MNPSNNQTPEPQATPTPVAPQQPAPVQPSMAAGSAGKKNKMPLIVGIIVGVLLVAGAVAYGVYAYVTNTPDYLLTQATENFGKTYTNGFAANIKIVSGTESSGVTFSGDIAAVKDASNANSGQVTLGLGSGSSRIALTALMVDDSLYIKGDTLENIGNLAKTFAGTSADTYNDPDFKAAIQRLDGQWFSLSKDELQSLAESTGTSAGSSISDSISPQELQQLYDLYNKNRFFVADKAYNDETISGAKSAHFTVKIDNAKMVAFLTALKNANLKSFKVTDQDITDAKNSANDFSKNAVVDVWVARDSKTLKQIRYTGIKSGEEGSFTLTFGNNPSPSGSLKKPTDAKPFSEILSTLLGPAASALDPSAFDLNAQ